MQLSDVDYESIVERAKGEDNEGRRRELLLKLWNYCNVLRDDGLSYQDYIEQLTFLLFLKMADEQTQAAVQPTRDRPQGLGLGRRWCASTGTAWRSSTGTSWPNLGKYPGTLGVIFRKAQNKIQDPAKLKRLVSDLIDREQWMTLDADVKGDAYEGLLAKNAEDVKTGAGQYFTPRPLIQAIVDVMRPDGRPCGCATRRRGPGASCWPPTSR